MIVIAILAIRNEEAYLAASAIPFATGSMLPLSITDLRTQALGFTCATNSLGIWSMSGSWHFGGRSR